VQFILAGLKRPRLPQDCLYLCRIVSLNWQTTALRWSIHSKDAKHHMTARTNRLLEARHIRPLIFFMSEEVKDGPVVPYIARVKAWLL
jgi:hypothetical protein